MGVDGADLGGLGLGLGVGGVDLGGAGCGLGGDGEGEGWGCGLGVGGDRGVEAGGGVGLRTGGLGLGGEDFPPHLDLLQSTGRLTTGKHVLADFCFGLSDKQLLVSSNVMSALEGGWHDGASPLKKL